MAVNPTQGGFWLQHANREMPQLLVFADELGQGPLGRPGVAFGPLNSPTALNPSFERARTAGEAILDPHGHLLSRSPTVRSRNHFPWLVQAPPPTAQSEWEAWMDEALAHQLSPSLCGSAQPPAFVITASPQLQAANGTSELYSVMDAAAAVASRVASGTDCWLGVAVDRTYIREPLHLTRLLNAVLATGLSGMVFRASHAQLAPVDDLAYLRGLREVVQACEQNEIRIFLPNSGWLGWLAMGWGAWGFSGGMAAGTWVDREPGPMNQPDQPANPFFEHQLMRTVRWNVHQQLVAEPSYLGCGCPDCVAMSGQHDLLMAKRHQMRHAHEAGFAVVALPTAQRAMHVADRLDAAIAFRDGLPSPLKERAGAVFLDRWRALI